MKKIIINFSMLPGAAAVVVDPHTAIGLGAIIKTVNENKGSGVNTANTISLATAHPAKFPEATKFAYGGAELPRELKRVMNKKENFNIMDNNIDIIKSYILKKI